MLAVSPFPWLGGMDDERAGFPASHMNSKLKIRASRSWHAGTEGEASHVARGKGCGNQLSRKRQQYCVVTGRFHRLDDVVVVGVLSLENPLPCACTC